MENLTYSDFEKSIVGAVPLAGFTKIKMSLGPEKKNSKIILEDRKNNVKIIVFAILDSETGLPKRVLIKAETAPLILRDTESDIEWIRFHAQKRRFRYKILRDLRGEHEKVTFTFTQNSTVQELSYQTCFVFETIVYKIHELAKLAITSAVKS